MLKGVHTALRAIEESDLQQLLDWRNKPHFRRYFRESRELSYSQQESWFETVVTADPNVRMFSIIDTSNRLLGACGLCYINWKDRNADISIYIGDQDIYIDDQLAPDAATTLLKYGFHELGLHRVWAEIYSIDTAKMEFFKSLNFQPDGRHRETHWTEGQWVDSLYFSLLAHEFNSV